MTPDPITTALTPLATTQQELETLAMFAAPGYGNEARRQAMILTGRFASVIDLAEKLKAERDGFAATVVSLAELVTASPPS